MKKGRKTAIFLHVFSITDRFRASFGVRAGVKEQQFCRSFGQQPSVFGRSRDTPKGAAEVNPQSRRREFSGDHFDHTKE